jgi:hypothetical protein
MERQCKVILSEEMNIMSIYGFDENDIKTLEPCEKIGLLAAVDPEGKPHITLITSIQPIGKDKLAFGEFSWGLSKYYVRENSRCGFLMMTLDKSLWRGRALWTGAAGEGPEYIMFNEKPMFRYNTYFGINTVHYLDLKDGGAREKLPMFNLVKSVILTALSGKSSKNKNDDEPLNLLGRSFFNSLSSLKFLAYVDSDGFPVIIPVIQCRAADPGLVKFSTAAYRDELEKIPEGAECAVFAMTLDMESVLVRGRFTGIRRRGLAETGEVEISWVYNSMPPVHGQVYPAMPLEAVKFQA